MAVGCELVGVRDLRSDVPDFAGNRVLADAFGGLRAGVEAIDVLRVLVGVADAVRRDAHGFVGVGKHVRNRNVPNMARTPRLADPLIIE